MTGAEIENALRELLASGEPREYGALLTSVPEVGQDKVAAALWRMRSRKQVVFRLTARPGQKPLHTVEMS